MMIAKWNFKTHEYESWTPPDTAQIVMYSNDMDLPINCTNCLKEMVYGDGFTSYQHQNALGFGYPVCEECYELERDLRETSSREGQR